MTVSLFRSTPSTLLTNVAAADLVDLAWELTCAAGVVVKIDVVETESGPERCVSARCIPGERPFMLIPRGGEYVEVWWGEYDERPRLLGVAVDVESTLSLARRSLEPLRRSA